jgi:hypothetical protein
MMSMRFVIAALFACGCVDLSEPPGWVAADDYINTAINCHQSADPQACEKTRTAWDRNYADALSGSYAAQRTISFCLSTSCDQAIREDRILGCAWRLVISRSGHPEAGEIDEADRRRFCGSDMLDDAARKTAETQSQTLLSLLKKTS